MLAAMTVHYARIERGVAPLWAIDGSKRALLGVCTIVEPERAAPVALALTEVFARAAGRDIFVGTDLGGGLVAVTGADRTRWSALSTLALAPTRWPTDDVSPIPLARVCAYRSAPEAEHFAVALDAGASDGPLQRRSVALGVQTQRYGSRGGAGDDVELLLAAHASADPPRECWLEGAPVIARLPASRRLGTPAEDRLLGVLLPSPTASRFSHEDFAPWAELVQIELR